MLETEQADIVIIGANPGGCAAAIAAARSGCSVILLESTATVGGMLANGVCGFDTASPAIVSGIAKEIEAAIRAHYAEVLPDDSLLKRRSDQVWEPHVAAKVWADVVAREPGIRLRLGAVPVQVSVQDGRLVSVQWRQALDPMGNVSTDDHADRLARGTLFIDASYEGDIAAWAGAPFRLGREARSRTEPHAGVIFTNNLEAKPHGFLAQSILPGSTGAADDAIMGFSFRMICRRFERGDEDAPHRVKPPTGYDAGRYRWHPLGVGEDGKLAYFNSLYVVVNDKLLLNRMAFGNNMSEPARSYVLAHPTERTALREHFIRHSLGFLHYVQTSGGMPELGLATDEFADNGHFPRQLYIREARRIEAQTMLSEAEINPFVAGDGLRPPRRVDAIAVADWMIESVTCRDATPDGYPYAEGFVFARATQAPFQIPYGALLPQGVDNLLCPGPLGATHIGFSAARCEGARIQTGTAAGFAGALAVKGKTDPAAVPLRDLQDALISAGVELTHFSDLDATHPDFASIQRAALRGIVPAEEDYSFRPDEPARWSDLVEAIVLCLDLPVSVTGVHFEHVPRRHLAFRWFEAVYDLGMAAGVDIFDAGRLAIEDPMRDFIRFSGAPKRIPLRPDAVMDSTTARRVLQDVLLALGAPGADLPVAEGQLTRAGLCRLVDAAHAWLDRQRGTARQPATGY
jgi:hypothetical protein